MLDNVCVFHVVIEPMMRIIRIVQNGWVINVRQIILALEHSWVLFGPHALISRPDAQIILHHAQHPLLWVRCGWKFLIDTHL